MRLNISVFLLFTATLMNVAWGTLELVQTVFRHGDRTPEHTFPNDPYRYYWKEGKEMLTKLGELQQYKLGQYFRRRYKDFLSKQYHYNHTVVRSTDNDRAILSVQSQMLGLFGAPVDTDVSNDHFPLPQLVPIHTCPKSQDQLLKMTSPCPAYTRLWEEMQESRLWKDLTEKYRHFFDDLQCWTGEENVDLIKAFQLADPITAWLAHNLSLPAWATHSVTQTILEVKNLKQWLRYYTREMQRLRGGPLVGVMTENMLRKIKGSDLQRRRLWYSYSGHDSTIAAVSMYLGVFNKIQPPYCACLIVELHKQTATDNALHTVRLLYKNDSRHDPVKLTMPGCEFDCPLEKFIQLTQDNVPEDVRKECFGDDSFLPRWPINVRMAPWWWIITLLSCAIVIVLVCTTKRFIRASSVTRRL